MRIIAGQMKGRRLQTPKDNKVRPTSDKVKEAVFSMVAPYLEDAVVVDLFAGTGNLGLEAISRGAKKCFFADKSKESLSLIHQNVEHCKAQNKSKILPGDFTIALETIYKYLQRTDEKIDIVFLDPPYGLGLIEKCLAFFSEQQILAEDGIVVAEHDIKEEISVEKTTFYIEKKKRYGKIGITILAHNLEE